MNKCFLPMLLFCVAACFTTSQGNIVAQVPCSTWLTLHTCAREGKILDTVPAPAVPVAAKSYHYKIFTNADGTYGYDIFTGTKKLIHQATVPGQPGNKGFTRESSAVKVATLVMGKLQQNIFPPTVSTAELKELGVRY